MLAVSQPGLLEDSGGFDGITGIPRLYSVDVKISVATRVRL